jgi:hypothetical protein
MSTEDAASDQPVKLTDGEIVDRIEGLLKGVSNNRAQNILKMVGAVHNVRFVPAFAPVMVPNALPPGRDTRGQKQSRSQPKANEKTKLFRSKIKEINSKISKKSKDLGQVKLPDGDPLLAERDQLFRDFEEEQNNPVKTLEEALNKKAERALQSSAGGKPKGSPPLRHF